MPRCRSALSLIAALMLCAAPASASSPRHPTTPKHLSTKHRAHARPAPSRHTKRYATGVPRDSHGRVQRSSRAKHEFEILSGYPHGRPGYVVDHVIPLSKGGVDDPGNMQWQRVREAKAKDRIERR